MAELRVEKRAFVGFPFGEELHVILVGCGGTGSFLALHLARLAWHLRERKGQALPLTFVDPDVLEEKNVGRQNFCPAEVGQAKAWALMRRYNAAFGLDIQARVTRLDRQMLDGRRPTLLIGAVDNAAGRRSLYADTVENRQVWWLDCGNHEHSGQVLLGNREDLTAPEISPLGFCGGLPLPSVQHPELLENLESRIENPESCAELALRDAQSLMINQMMAGIAAGYVSRLVLSRDLDVYATYVDLATLGMRSLGIVKQD